VLTNTVKRQRKATRIEFVANFSQVVMWSQRKQTRYLPQLTHSSSSSSRKHRNLSHIFHCCSGKNFSFVVTIASLPRTAWQMKHSMSTNHLLNKWLTVKQKSDSITVSECFNCRGVCTRAEAVIIQLFWRVEDASSQLKVTAQVISLEIQRYWYRST